MPVIGQAPALPKWTAKEKTLWLDTLQESLGCLLPADDDGFDNAQRREARSFEAAQLAAKVADMVVQEFQFREYSQTAEAQSGAGIEHGFDKFSRWLDQRARRRKPKRKTRRVTR